MSPIDAIGYAVAALVGSIAFALIVGVVAGVFYLLTQKDPLP